MAVSVPNSEIVVFGKCKWQGTDQWLSDGAPLKVVDSLSGILASSCTAHVECLLAGVEALTEVCCWQGCWVVTAQVQAEACVGCKAEAPAFQILCSAYPLLLLSGLGPLCDLKCEGCAPFCAALCIANSAYPFSQIPWAVPSGHSHRCVMS